MKLRRTLIDNSQEGYNMTEVLKECLKDKNVTEVYIATGFWDLRGTALVYDELAEFLSREGSKFRLLIGKDPYLYTSDTQSYTKGRYDKQEQAWRIDLDKFCAQEQYVKVVQMLVDNLKDKDSEKFQIHIYKPDGELKDQFLHSKCYIFKGYDNEEECNVGYGIIGSTNFTQKGMEGNSELNTLEINARDVISLDPEFKKDKTHLLWFNEKWNDSVSWEEEFLLQITQSKMAPGITIPEPDPAEDTISPLTPYELYIKLLHYQFGDLIDTNKSQIISSYLPQQYSPLEYQMDAVKQCFSIMKTHGGFMLADVVGLGKTIVGTLVIKYFLNYPDAERAHKVLIITPPAIQSAWIETIKEFDKDSSDQIAPYVDYITTGSIDHLIEDEDWDTGAFNGALKYNNYGLIIIDESHKFRNSDTEMYESLDNLIAQINDNTGYCPYIGLLSATPQNNTPEDLKNQIYLFERNRQYCSLEKVEGRNLQAYFSGILGEYNALKKEDREISQKPIKTPTDLLRLQQIKEAFDNISANIRDTILCDILVRRTRTDIKEYYKDDMERQQLLFPEISGPHNLRYKMDDELAQLFADTMDLIAPSPTVKAAGAEYLGYLRYRSIQFLAKQTDKDKYKGRGKIDSDALADQLAKIMQNLLVKRLESSFSAFTRSLQNLRNYTDNMRRMWDNNTIFICPQIDVNEEFDIAKKTEKRGHKVTFDECVEDIRNKIIKLTDSGKNEKHQNCEYTREDFDANYIVLLKKDYDLITGLYDRWSRNSEDPKLDEFKESLKPILFNPETNSPQKLVIFSEAVDTVDTLKRAVERKGYSVLKITADNREKDELKIRENFDANYKGVWKDDYQVIITTEVLAEGINLHRANVILNYDTPWNSTKLMQRIGRVNRIGSREKYVYVYNFMPSAEGDEQIQLVEKAHLKIQSFHTLFGEDAKVFTEDENVAHYELKKFVDGDESPFEKYLHELKQYREDHPLRYEYIISQEGDLQMAIENRKGDSFLVVRTPKTKGLYVHVSNDGKGRIIRALDLFSAFKTDDYAVRAALPDDWSMVQKTAIQTVGQHLARINNYKVKDNAATKAKGIIIQLTEKSDITPKSRQLLDDAFGMIKKGNTDIIRTILAIGREVFGDTDNLFKMNQDEIDSIISKKLDLIVEEQAKLIGKPEVYMALAK